MPTPPEKLDEFDSLIKIVAILRGPKGCPWDKAQTLRSLSAYSIEEAHEYAQAVEGENSDEILSELGDLLLQVVLNSQVAKDAGIFEFRDVVKSISEKMVRRHPHVFGDQVASTPNEVKANWELIKDKEKDTTSGAVPEDFDIPKALPALQFATKVGHKTKKEKFDWPNLSGVWKKVEEEVKELSEVLDPVDKDRCQAELGDVLFSLAQLARHLDLDAEQCLRQANARFTTRFFRMKELAAAGGTKIFAELSEERKEELWRQAKLLELNEVHQVPSPTNKGIL